MAARRLTFPLSALAPVLTGAKCATVRFSKTSAAARPGDVLVLAFGRYDRPVTFSATVRRVERIDLQELRRAFDLAPDVLSLKAEHEFYSRPLEPDETTAPELLEALSASGGDFEALLLEAAERGVNVCTAVWWTLS